MSGPTRFRLPRITAADRDEVRARIIEDAATRTPGPADADGACEQRMHLRHILHSPGGGRFVAPVECYRSLDAAEAGTRRPTFAVPRTARLTWVLTPCNCVRLDGVADQ